MSHVKNVSRDLLNLKHDNETSLSHSRSVDADLPRPDAIWVFPIGAFCGDDMLYLYKGKLFFTRLAMDVNTSEREKSHKFAQLRQELYGYNNRNHPT